MKTTRGGGRRWVRMGNKIRKKKEKFDRQVRTKK